MGGRSATPVRETAAATDGPSPIAERGRAVILVGNPAAPYSRALRIARALDGLGFAVEIAAVAATDVPAVEDDGRIVTRRYTPTGRWARVGASAGRGRAGSGGRKGAGWFRRVGAALRRWLFWPHGVRGWWAALDAELAPADLYHACGSLTIRPALAARSRQPTGPSGRPARVLYDSIDDVFEGNNVLDMPPPVRAWHRRRETSWARSADAVLTINTALAERLQGRWHLSRAPLVVPNYPESPPLAAILPPPDLIRRELGLPATNRIVLYQGRMGPHLALDGVAEAVLTLPDTVFVLIGFGRWYAASQARDAEARFRGRHFTLPARHPDELLAWTASADVTIVAAPPVSLTQVLSSPNKLWESIGAGTPIVVNGGLEVMAGVVAADDLGAVADSDAPADLARALAAVLDAPAAEAAARRERCLRVARERYNWELAVEPYRSLVQELCDLS